MIDFITGTVEHVGDGVLVVSAGGIGYALTCSSNALSELSGAGDRVKVYTQLNVSDSGIALYGFSSRQEREVFLRLTSVSKVGPKVALSILSQYTASQVTLFIVSKDISALTKASGVGKKLAESIVFNLKDKFEAGGEETGDLSFDFAAQAGPKDEAVLALSSLGFEKAYCIKLVNSVYEDGLACEELISRALMLAGK